MEDSNDELCQFTLEDDFVNALSSSPLETIPPLPTYTSPPPSLFFNAAQHTNDPSSSSHQSNPTITSTTTNNQEPELLRQLKEGRLRENENNPFSQKFLDNMMELCEYLAEPTNQKGITVYKEHPQKRHIGQMYLSLGHGNGGIKHASVRNPDTNEFNKITYTGKHIPHPSANSEIQLIYKHGTSTDDVKGKCWNTSTMKRLVNWNFWIQKRGVKQDVRVHLCLAAKDRVPRLSKRKKLDDSEINSSDSDKAHSNDSDTNEGNQEHNVTKEKALWTPHSVRKDAIETDKHVLVNQSLEVAGIVTAQQLVELSDERTKENFEEVDTKEDLAKVNKIKRLNFNYKEGDTSRTTGTTAQSIQGVMPDATAEIKDGPYAGKLGIKHIPILFTVVGAVQELTKQNKKIFLLLYAVLVLCAAVLFISWKQYSAPERALSFNPEFDIDMAILDTPCNITAPIVDYGVELDKLQHLFNLSIEIFKQPRQLPTTWIVRKRELKMIPNYYRNIIDPFSNLITSTEFENQTDTDVKRALSERIVRNWHLLFPIMGTNPGNYSDQVYEQAKEQDVQVHFEVISAWNNNTAPLFCEVLLDGLVLADSGHIAFETGESAKQSVALAALQILKQPGFSAARWKEDFAKRLKKRAPKSLSTKFNEDWIYFSQYRKRFMYNRRPPVSEFPGQNGIAKLQLLASILDKAREEKKITDCVVDVSIHSHGHGNFIRHTLYAAELHIDHIPIGEPAWDYWLIEDALTAVALQALKTIDTWGPAFSISSSSVFINASTDYRELLYKFLLAHKMPMAYIFFNNTRTTSWFGESTYISQARFYNSSFAPTKSFATPEEATNDAARIALKDLMSHFQLYAKSVEAWQIKRSAPDVCDSIGSRSKIIQRIFAFQKNPAESCLCY